MVIIRHPSEDTLPLLSVGSRYWPHLEEARPTGCWMWTGPKEGTGNRIYGRMIIGHKGITYHLTTHRYALALKTGRWLKKEEWALHTCHVMLCSNPMHLYIGTARQNALDAVKFGRMYVGSIKRGRPAEISDEVAAQIIELFAGPEGNAFHYSRFYKFSTWTIERIARRFQVSRTAIKNVVIKTSIRSHVLHADQITAVRTLWTGPRGQGRFPGTVYNKRKWSALTLSRKFKVPVTSVMHVLEGHTKRHLHRPYFTNSSK